MGEEIGRGLKVRALCAIKELKIKEVSSGLKGFEKFDLGLKGFKQVGFCSKVKLKHFICIIELQIFVHLCESLQFFLYLCGQNLANLIKKSLI